MYCSEWMKTSCASLMMAALILQPATTLAQDRISDEHGNEKNLVEIAPRSGAAVALHTLSVENSPYLSHDQKLDLLRKHIKYVFVLFQENPSTSTLAPFLALAGSFHSRPTRRLVFTSRS